MRTKHYSKKTEESYTRWIKQFILYSNKVHPENLGAESIKNYINHLAVEKHVSSSTQNQALQGILFLYRNILKKEIGWIEDIKYVRQVTHLPVVFSRDEVFRIINNLEGVIELIVSVLYGTGMRITEALRLRVKDIDLEMNQIIIRDGKGEKDRITLLPQKLKPILKEHIKK